MSEDSQVVAARLLASLRADYVRRAPAELGRLEILAERLVAESVERAVLQDLRDGLHKLAGSAGSFGLPDLGSNARSLERSAARWLEGDLTQIDKGSLRSLAAGVAALPTLLEESLEPSTAPSPGAGTSAASVPSSSSDRHLWSLVSANTGDGTLIASLAQFGYRIRSIATLEALLEALHALPTAAVDKPDAVICDASPEGSDATVALAGCAPLPCPVVMVASEDRIAQRARAAKLGVRSYLLRPLDASVLADHLERALSARRDEPYRVLIVDDDVDLARHYQLVLEIAGMEVQTLSEPARIVEQVAAQRPEMVLLDLNMPDYSGPELAGILRQYDEWIGLPIVYISAETDLDRQIDALGHGADDFLVKPISDTHLVAAVRVRAARFRQLADLVTKDGLTGLLRHARIKEEIALQLARARRSGRAIAVAMVDIDHFKSVNDTYGHATGDRVIKALSSLLRQRLRRSDSIGRYGGEEFVALLPDCDAERARDIIEDIRARFAELRFQHEGREFASSLSAGVASALDFLDAKGDELLSKADEALYEAKHGGRNQVRIAR